MVLPTNKERVLEDKVMEETGTVTVTVQLAFTPLPSFAITVMVVVPPLTGVTMPSLLTVATEG